MDRATFRAVQEMIRPLWRKLQLVATRAVVSIAKDTTGTQGLQAKGLKGEVFDYSEHMQPGGLTHVPLAGAEGVFLTIGGARDDGVILCVGDRRHRPTGLASGETALFNDSASQSKVTIRANGDVEVSLAAAAKLKIGGATESFVKGDTFFAAFTTWLTAHDTYVKIPTPTVGETSTYTAASTAFVAAWTGSKSTTIKGE